LFDFDSNDADNVIIIDIDLNQEDLNKLKILINYETKNQEIIGAGQVEKMLIQYGLAKTGDKVILTYGHPITEGAKTNQLYIFNLGGEKYTRLPEGQIPLRCQQE
jgi:pyruvate kinase